MSEVVSDLLTRFVAGDVSAVEALRAASWREVLNGTRSSQGLITREGARRVLLASRDPGTADAAWAWASFVRDGTFDPWVLEDGFLHSRPIPGRRGEVEFALEPGCEDTILDVVHRIDDINIDGPIQHDEFVELLESLS